MRSARLPEPYVFYVDECIRSRIIVGALEAACQEGETIVVAPRGQLDEVWLNDAGTNGWLCLTADKRVKKNPAEIGAIRAACVGIVITPMMNAQQLSVLIIGALGQIRQAARQSDRPFIAALRPSGDLAIQMSGGQWQRDKVIKRARVEPKPKSGR